MYKLHATSEARASKVQFDENTGEYLLQSNGGDVWDNEDEIVYLWTTRPGSYRMTVRAQWLQQGGSDWAKTGIMIRNEPEREDSAMVMFQYRGAEDQTERSIRYTRTGSADHASYHNEEHENTVFLGANSAEPIWMRLTRIYPGNQFIYEDANESFDGDGTPAEEDWEIVNSDFAAGFPMPNEINWGIFHLDHQEDVTILPPDESLIKNVRLEPVVAGSRFLSESHFSSGDSIEVTITLNNEGDPTTANVTENIPTGWTADNISDGGSISGETITWSVDNFQGLQDISYTLTPPADAVQGTVTGDVNGIPTAGNISMGVTPSNEGEVGDFDGSGGINATGSAVFDNGTYTVSSTGDVDGDENVIYGPEDSLYFVWKAFSGDFMLEIGESNVPVPGPNNETRVGIMVRDSLSSTSSFLSIAQRSDFSIKHERRDLAGQNSFFSRMSVQFAGPGGGVFTDEFIPVARNDFGGFRLTREDTLFRFEFRDLDNLDVWTTANIPTMAFTDPVYVGLFVHSNSEDVSAEGTFTNVTVTPDKKPVLLCLNGLYIDAGSHVLILDPMY